LSILVNCLQFTAASQMNTGNFAVCEKTFNICISN